MKIRSKVKVKEPFVDFCDFHAPTDIICFYELLRYHNDCENNESESFYIYSMVTINGMMLFQTLALEVVSKTNAPYISAVGWESVGEYNIVGSLEPHRVSGRNAIIRI